MDRRRRLKVLIVTDAYYPYPSGLSEYVHHLANKLRHMGHLVDVAAGSFGTREERTYAVERVGRCVLIPLNKSFATLPVGSDVPSRMRWLMREGGYDVVHLNGPMFPNLSYFALKYSNARNVATFHTASEKVTGFGNGLFKMIFGRVFEKIDVRIGDSEDAVRTNMPYVPGYYHVIPPGVETALFNPAGEKDASLAGHTVLFIGRMDPRKGLDRLLDAFPLVRRQVADARLIVVGGGPLHKKYVKLVRAMGIGEHVSFAGSGIGIPIARYLRSATVFTSPAVGGESFGIVLIEAMASGTPVIASNIAGYNRVIDHGRNGLLVDTADKTAYAEAIVRLLNDERARKKMVAEGLHDVRTKYSWDLVARKIERLYRA